MSMSAVLDFVMDHIPAVIGGSVLLTMGLARWFAADLYDIVIVHMTRTWYREVLTRMQPGDHVLDVGIGTATSLLRNADLIREKKITLVGVDLDSRYVTKAKKGAIAANLESSLQVHCGSVYDPKLGDLVNASGPEGKLFDAAYFSGSFSLMPDPVAALHATAALLKKKADKGSADEGGEGGARIYITQTYQRVGTPLMGVLKPLMKHVTTIDFGQLTYEKDLIAILKESGMKVLDNSIIEGSIDNAFQVARVVVLDPHTAALKTE